MRARKSVWTERIAHASTLRHERRLERLKNQTQQESAAPREAREAGQGQTQLEARARICPFGLSHHVFKHGVNSWQ